jgi:hypothetical protein
MKFTAFLLRVRKVFSNSCPQDRVGAWGFSEFSSVLPDKNQDRKITPQTLHLLFADHIFMG